MNLTCCIEKHLPGYTRGDDWFGERMMNGMNCGCFVPHAARAGHYWMRYFGVCWYDINDLYALPDIAILFWLKDDGLPSPLEIHLTGRLSRSDDDLFAPVCSLPPMEMPGCRRNVSPASRAPFAPRSRNTSPAPT